MVQTSSRKLEISDEVYGSKARKNLRKKSQKFQKKISWSVGRWLTYTSTFRAPHRS